MAVLINGCFSIFCLCISNVYAQTSNLPYDSPGVFEVEANTTIKTTTAAIWETLTNFPAYPEWNPFVRLALMVSPLNISLPEQRPQENGRLFMRVQIPPLPFPVNKDTPDNLLNTQFTYENVTHVQPELGRLAWAYAAAPEEALDAERWQAISDLGNGTVLYESREVYRGALATALKDLYGEGLQKGFEAQAQGLKMLLEGTA